MNHRLQMKETVAGAFPHLGECTRATLFRAIDALRGGSLETDFDVPEWSDPDKLRALALQLYVDDWEKGDYNADEVQRDLIRIADRLDSYERSEL